MVSLLAPFRNDILNEVLELVVEHNVVVFVLAKVLGAAKHPFSEVQVLFLHHKLPFGCRQVIVRRRAFFGTLLLLLLLQTHTPLGCCRRAGFPVIALLDQQFTHTQEGDCITHLSNTLHVSSVTVNNVDLPCQHRLLLFLPILSMAVCKLRFRCRVMQHKATTVQGRTSFDGWCKIA